MPERKRGPICQFCGYNTNPSTALFCLGCGELMRPEVFKPSEPLKFPRFMDLRTWLEGRAGLKGWFSPYCRGFGICFVLMDVPRSVVAPDGTLRVQITGIYRKLRFAAEVRVRKEEFVERRFEGMTISVKMASYVFTWRKPVIPVPVDGGYTLEMWFQSDAGMAFHSESVAWFMDPPPAAVAPTEPRAGP